MLGRPLAALPIVAISITAGAGCDRSGAEPSSAPPVSAVEVPAVPSGTEHPSEVDPLAESPPPPPDEVEPLENRDGRGTAVEVDAGYFRFSVPVDGGARFWGTFRAVDGGFTFRGSFSVGTGSGAGDAGSGPTP